MSHAVRLLLLALLFLTGQQELCASIPKTRVGNFFPSATSSRPEIALQVPELRLDNPLLYGESVSGDTFWTKFDPEGLDGVSIWDVLTPATAAVARGGRSPWGGERGAIEHSLTVTQPILRTAAVTGYAVAAAPAIAATAVTAVPEGAVAAVSVAATQLANTPGVVAGTAAVAAGAVNYADTHDLASAATATALGGIDAYANGAFNPGGTSARIQLQINKTQGDLFEKELTPALEQTQDNVQSQVTLKTPSGVRVRLDNIGNDKTTGAVKLTDGKSSSTADLRKNQKVAYPEIEEKGATVVGAGKPGFPGGTAIPPTKVDIVRPSDLDNMKQNGGN